VYVAALLALVALAGCSAIGGGAGDGSGVGTPGGDTTVTPAPVPTDRPDGSLAPGLTNDGVVDAERLAEAHRRALADRSYTERSLTVVTRRSGGSRLGARVLVSRRGAEAFTIRYDLLGEPREAARSYETVSAVVWSNGSETVQAITDETGTRYEALGTSFYGNYAAPDALLYARVLERNPVDRVERVTADGATGYRVTATLESPPPSFGLSGTVATGPADLVALVSTDGVVRRVVVTYPARYRGEAARVEHRFEYRDVGNTSVSRPPWFEQAIENGSDTLDDGPEQVVRGR
jgi:hypothetical protein